MHVEQVVLEGKSAGSQDRELLGGRSRDRGIERDSQTLAGADERRAATTT